MAAKNKFFSCKVSAKGLVASFALAAAGIVAFDQSVDHIVPGRSMTDGEVEMFQDMYGTSIDYEKVKVHHSRFFDTILRFIGSLGGTKSNVIIMDSEIYREDFSQQDTGVGAKHVYVHEMAHVWQRQNCQSSLVKSLVEQFSIRTGAKQAWDVYDYVLQEGRDLTEYGIEQQAEILANYHELKSGDELYTVDTKNKTMDRFEETLQNFIKDPSYARKDCWFPR